MHVIPTLKCRGILSDWNNAVSLLYTDTFLLTVILYYADCSNGEMLGQAIVEWRG